MYDPCKLRSKQQKNLSLRPQTVEDLEYGAEALRHTQGDIVDDAIAFWFGRQDPGLVDRHRAAAKAIRQKSGQHLANKGDSNA